MVGDTPENFAAISHNRSMSLSEYIKHLKTGDFSGLPHGNATIWYKVFHDNGPSASCKADRAAPEQQLHRAMSGVLAKVLSALGLDGELAERSDYGLGPSSVGVPQHTHARAINLLLHGAKRWFLPPPRKGAWSNRAPDWPQPSEARSLECMQWAGDVMFVPDEYPHGTVNMQTSTSSLSWVLFPYSEVDQRPVRWDTGAHDPRCEKT